MQASSSDAASAAASSSSSSSSSSSEESSLQSQPEPEPRLRPSRFCRKFDQSQSCPYGHHCQFIHDYKYKTLMCQNINMPNGCRYGGECRFAHSIQELRCPYGTHCNKRRTARCRLQHVPFNVHDRVAILVTAMVWEGYWSEYLVGTVACVHWSHEHNQYIYCVHLDTPFDKPDETYAPIPTAYKSSKCKRNKTLESCAVHRHEKRGTCYFSAVGRILEPR